MQTTKYLSDNAEDHKKSELNNFIDFLKKITNRTMFFFNYILYLYAMTLIKKTKVFVIASIPEF